MQIEYTVSALVTLLVIVDPVGLMPAFLALTPEVVEKARLKLALRAACIAGSILFGTALIGNWLLGALGISLDAFRIAGGLLLFVIASEMLFGLRAARQAKHAQRTVEGKFEDVAAFPLAIPLIAGPGAITATVLLAQQAQQHPKNIAVLAVVIVLVMSLTLAAFAMAAKGARLLGETGNIVLSRLLGVLLAAQAVQFVIDGMRASFAR
jgi:multiple antibiotic resistance protein